MVKLFSLNIERSKHLHRFLPFVRCIAPDILCLQEVVSGDLDRIRDETGLAHAHMAEMAIHPEGNVPFGVSILSRHPFDAVETLVYAGTGSGRDKFDRTTDETKIRTCRYVLACARLTFAGTTFAVATTHFPWTPDGLPRPFQHTAAARLVELLADQPVILTGDFNAPRGGPVFATFADKWRDWIPAGITTSLDPDLHRAGPLDLMVDGLFTSPHYRAGDTRLVPGLSDHQGIEARIEHVA